MGSSRAKSDGTGCDPIRQNGGDGGFGGCTAGARRRIWVQMFHVTEPTLVRALGRAARRAVDVRVLCDPNEFSLGVQLSGAPNLPFVKALMELGVPVHLCDAAPGAQMHQKSIVVDSSRVFAGATNLTRQSFRVNTESAFFVDGPDLAEVFERRFTDERTLCSKLVARLFAHLPIEPAAERAFLTLSDDIARLAVASPPLLSPVLVLRDDGPLAAGEALARISAFLGRP